MQFPPIQTQIHNPQSSLWEFLGSSGFSQLEQEIAVEMIQLLFRGYKFGILSFMDLKKKVKYLKKIEEKVTFFS